MPSRHRALPALLALVLGLGGCAVSTEVPPGLRANSDPHGHSAPASATPAKASPKPTVPARKGETFRTIQMAAAYQPTAPTAKGTDEYRCFLLDPDLSVDSLVSGIDIHPGNPALVHHVIVYQAPPDRLADAKRLDAAADGPGWTCFGGTGLERRVGGNLDSAGWVGGWAPGGGERIFPEDIGIPLAKGTRLILQMHYNLLGGSGTDQSSVRLRLTPAAGTTRKALETMLLPAPVELPCRDGKRGGLCYRSMSISDIKARFQEEVATADLLHLLCGPIKAGPVQSCTRPVREPAVIRAVSGHMHLLGRAITIDVNKGTPGAKRVLDIPVWDFDNQTNQPLDTPVKIAPGDTLTVTCTHDQSLRDRLPAFQDQPERYVAWGDGSTDEMCLGIVMLTRS